MDRKDILSADHDKQLPGAYEQVWRRMNDRDIIIIIIIIPWLGIHGKVQGRAAAKWRNQRTVSWPRNTCEGVEETLGHLWLEWPDAQQVSNRKMMFEQSYQSIVDGFLLEPHLTDTDPSK